MRNAILATLALLAGCASTSTQGNQSLETVNIGNTALRMGTSSAHVTSVDVPVAQVFRMLPAIFDSLSIPVTDLDPQAYIMGNGALRAHKTLGKVPLTRYIDCGSAQGFPSAETYEIQLDIKTQLIAKPAPQVGTTVSTLLEAAARPLQFKGDWVRCTSKGALEKAIYDRLKAMTG